MIPQIVISFVAERLVSKFAERVLQKDPLQEALDKLLNIGAFAEAKVGGNSLISILGRIGSISDVTDDVVDGVTGAIGKFQKLFKFAPDGTVFNPDGLIGEKTLALLDSLVSCIDPREEPPADAPQVIPGASRTIRYLVESLPDVAHVIGASSDAEILEIFSEAWTPWSVETGLNIMQLDANDPDFNPNGVDVVVSTARLDGANGAKLAEAIVGPPSGRQLTMVIDEAETFAKEPGHGKPVFQAMCIHEIGHLLGLSHKLLDGSTAVAGSVMYPVHQPTVLSLHRQDIERIQAIFPPDEIIDF